ncbi:MAG: response regulator transcription factor [Flavobacteriales bacterium]|nr:response regulator transcription factor [Flavobacteriales bacterium]
MEIRCLIVDDEYLAQDLLEQYVKKVSYLTLIAKCDNALQASQILKDEQIDLMFLDIQMPDLSGLDFLKTLSEPPHVIFTTAYSEYALESYSLDVIDYLLKPIDFARFFKSIEKVASRMSLKSNVQNEIVEPLNVKSEREYMVIKSDGAVIKIYFSEILYLESLREYVRFHTKDKKYMVLSSMKSIFDSLPDNFVRIHKSFVAPFSRIKSVSGNMVKLDNGAELPIGKTYKADLMNRF